MRSLQTLLTILNGQHLTAGYLQPAGSGTALETVRALMNARSPIVTPGTPITPPDLLNTPAWVSSKTGTAAIYLNDVSGNLSTSQGPAYIMQ